VLNGNTISFPRLTKKLLNQNTTADPDGLFTDGDPTDPKYGKETGGVYQVTATLDGSGISASQTVVVLPTGTAPITAQMFDYANQLNSALGQVLNAYAAPGHAGLTTAKNLLQGLLATPGFNAQALARNQVLAPPNGQLVTAAQLTAAGFQSSPDDASFVTTLNSLHTTITNAIGLVNAITAASPTQAQMTAVQNATATYDAELTTLNALHPSSLVLANNNALLNQVMATDIPTLLDAIGNKMGAVAAPFSGSIRQ